MRIHAYDRQLYFNLILQDSNSPITGLCQQLESTFPSSLFPFQDSNLLVHVSISLIGLPIQ